MFNELANQSIKVRLIINMKKIEIVAKNADLIKNDIQIDENRLDCNRSNLLRTITNL